MVLDKVCLLEFGSARFPSDFFAKNIVGLSNTVAMDFGRALFGPIGGALFAFMVAFSCFGALNGVVLCCVLPLRKLIPACRYRLYFSQTCICRRTRTIYTPHFWQATPNTAYPHERSTSAGNTLSYFHHGWERVQVAHQFLGCCFYVILFSNSMEFLYCRRTQADLAFCLSGFGTRHTKGEGTHA